MKVGLHNIAKKLNISVSTVSRSLNNHPSVNIETRAQVIAAASQLGYRGPKGKQIRNTKAKTAYSIGVLIQSDDRFSIGQPSWQSHLLEGMSEVAYEIGIKLTVHYVPLKHRDFILEPEFQPHAMRDGSIDGLILVHYYPRDVVEKLSRQFPCVYIQGSYVGLPVDYVGIDNILGIEQIVSHLKDLGHSRVGFISCLPYLTWASSRFAGYVQACSRFGIAYDPANVIPECQYSGDRQETERMILEKTRSSVSAWVCVNDATGYNICRLLMQAGYKIPEQVSVTGFDNNLKPDDCPKLTTVGIRFHEIGAEAIRRIYYRVSNPAASIASIAFEPEIKIGETTAAVNICSSEF